MNWETGLKRGPFLRDNGLKKEAINIRMTGCPNGCAHSSLGEIRFIGHSIGSTIYTLVPAIMATG